MYCSPYYEMPEILNFLNPLKYIQLSTYSKLLGGVIKLIGKVLYLYFR